MKYEYMIKKEKKTKRRNQEKRKESMKLINK